MIRPATLADAEAIGQVHAQAWRESYRGIVPDPILAAQDPAERATLWRRVIPGGDIVLLAHAPDGTLLGFANAGAQREPEVLPFAGEINAIYLLQAAKRRGIGRALMAATARALLDRRVPSASLWVLDGNDAAHAFYTALGGRPIHHRPLPARREWVGTETAYGWDDLTLLAR